MVHAIETRARLREAFDHLSPKRRSIFEHVRIEGLSYATVAAMHGVTEDSVRMHMHQASKALRAAVHEAGDGLGPRH